MVRKAWPLELHDVEPVLLLDDACLHSIIAEKLLVLLRLMVTVLLLELCVHEEVINKEQQLTHAGLLEVHNE